MEIIIKSLIISFFCVGLRIVSGEGMILHFLRKPYEIVKNEAIKTILKPIIGCVTCMGSVWTIVISYFYFEVTKWTLLQIIIVCGFNAIIYAYYESINKCNLK